MAKLKDGTRIYGSANVNATLTTTDLVVTGNITVRGTTTTVDTTATTIKDPLITLGAAEDGNVPNDGHERGLVLKYANATVTSTGFMGWHTSNGEFALADTTTFDSANNEITIGTYGNVRALRFIGNGDSLTSLNGGNVTGTVANANMSMYAQTITVAGNSQPNITSVGTLIDLTVGNATAYTTLGNGTNTFYTTGTANIGGNLNVTGNANIGNLTVDGTITGTFSGSTSAPGANTQVVFNDANVSNATSGFTFNKDTNAVTVTGTITGGNLSTGGTANVTGTANVGNLVTSGFANIDKDLFIGKAGGGANSANANITGTLTVDDLATVNTLRTVGAANIEGTLTVVGGANAALTGNLSVTGNTTSTNGSIALTNGNISAGGTATVTGNATVGNLITGGNIDGTGASSTANVQYLTVRSTANITGTANVGNLVTPGYADITRDLLVGNVANVANANITGSLKVGSVLGDLNPITNYSGNLGNSTNAWKDLWLSGSTINLGSQTITSTTNGVSTSNTFSTNALLVQTNANIGNVSASSVGNLNVNGTITANGSITSNVLTDTRVLFSDATHQVVDDSTFKFTSGTSLLEVGNVKLTGTANAANVIVTTLTNTRVTFAGTDSKLVDDANLTYNVSLKTLSSDLFTGTLTTNAQPNVTSVGVLTSVTVSGDATVQGNVKTDNIRANGTGITMTAGTGGSITLVPEGAGTVDVSGKKITGVGAPTQSTDAATKGYVDATAQGLDVKNSVRAATVGDSGLSGLAAVDGVTIVSGDRILVRAQTDAEDNGIYVAAAGAWSRSVDTDATGKITGGTFTFVEQGTLYADTGWVVTSDSPITLDTTPINWTQFSGAGAYTADGTKAMSLDGGAFSVKINTTTMAFDGSGNLKVSDTATFVTPNIGAATGSSLDIATGNLTANVVLANAVSIQNSGNITGANVISGTTLTGTLSTASQPNITSVGTLANLTVTANTNLNGNVYISNATAGNGIFSDNYYYANGIAIDFQTAAGDATQIQFKSATGNNLSASANLTFSDSSNLTVTGNILNASGAIISGNIQANNLTSGRVVVADTGGKLVDSGNLTFSGTQLDVTGTANVSGTVNAGNITSNGVTATHVVFADTGGRLTSDADLTFDGTELKANAANVVNAFTAGNVTARDLTSGRITFATSGGKLTDTTKLQFDTGTNVMTVTGNIQLNGTAGEGSLNGNGSISMTGNITGARLEATGGGLILTTGNANVGNLNATYIAGTLTTAAQPNITSVGNLTALTVTGLTTLDTLANVKISGGANGQIISTDGAGNLSFISNDSGKIVNGSSNVSIPTLDGNIIMVSGGTTVLTVTGVGANITGTLDVTGNISGNHISAANTITASANTDSTSSITGTVKVTGGMAATGNIYTGKSVGFADNNGGTASKAYIQYNHIADSLDFIFN